MKPDQVLELWKWAEERSKFRLEDESDKHFFRQVMSVCRELAEKSIVEALYRTHGLNQEHKAWQSILDQMKDSQ